MGGVVRYRTTPRTRRDWRYTPRRYPPLRAGDYGTQPSSRTPLRGERPRCQYHPCRVYQASSPPDPVQAASPPSTVPCAARSLGSRSASTPRAAASWRRLLSRHQRRPECARLQSRAPSTPQHRSGRSPRRYGRSILRTEGARRSVRGRTAPSVTHPSRRFGRSLPRWSTRPLRVRRGRW